MSDHTLKELASLTGLSSRTIRYYISQGLVPAPGREGRATRYPRSTLARLRLIKAWRDQDLSLALIRKRLDKADEDEVISRVSRPQLPRRNLLMHSAAHSDFETADDVDRGMHLMAELPGRYADIDTTEPMWPPLQAGSRLGERSRWEHITITNDIELHVRRPLGARDSRLAGRVMELAHQLLEED